MSAESSYSFKTLRYFSDGDHTKAADRYDNWRPMSFWRFLVPDDSKTSPAKKVVVVVSRRSRLALAGSRHGIDSKSDSPTVLAPLSCTIGYRSETSNQRPFAVLDLPGDTDLQASSRKVCLG